MGREAANTSGKTDVLVFHGSTDAPAVDVVEVAVPAGTIVDNASYGDFAGYLELDPAAYSLQIRTQDQTTVAQYAADLSSLGNAALTVVASGFLNPANNSQGPAFGLYVATATGGPMIMLPTEDISTARVQVIHNSADAAAASVDVYLDDARILDDFAFRTASPFIDAPAGSSFDITIAPSSSADSSDGIWRKSYTLAGGSKYILIANGIVSATGYDPATAFDIYVYDMARESSMEDAKTDVLVFHGSTDAPVVDIYESTAGSLIDNLAYGEYADDYLELPTADYTIEVRDETGTTIVAAYQAPLKTLGLDDAAIVAVASGFLTPANNSDGAAFGIYVALAAGGDLVELPAAPATSSRDLIENRIEVTAFPNPVRDYLNLAFSIENASEVDLEIISITGQTMLRKQLGIRSAGEHTETLNMDSFQDGIYMLKLNTGDSIHTSRIKVVK
jgi:hypothetical protein